MLHRILFIYAKLNPGIKYIQGMNEVLAVIYYCYLENDGFSKDYKSEGEKVAVIPIEYHESDLFFSFTNIMSEMKDGFLRELDKEKNGTPDGQVGPVERELNNFPEIEGLIFGAYGEVSQHVDDLMHAVADKAASIHWRSMGAPSQQNAKAMYVTRFRE